MHRSLSAAALVAVLLVGLPDPWAKADSTDALSRARALLDRGEARPAIPLLEDALPAVSSIERPALLDLLRRAYDQAAREAEAAGQPGEAAALRDNLAILNRKPRSRPAQAPTPPSPSQPIPVPRAEVPAPLDLAVARASAVVETPSLPAPEPSRVPEPVRSVTLPDDNTPALPGDKAPAQSGLATQVAAADAAFVARRYDEAGGIYATLDRAHESPATRRDHWAYCRWVDVVRRINAGPGTSQEWASIDAEIEKIRTLSPKNWFGEYLRNRASERTAGRRTSKMSRVVIRGSSPDEPSPSKMPTNSQPAPTRPPVPNQPGALRPAAPQGTEAAEAAHEVNRAPGQPGNWQVRETPSFRIMHADAELAEKVAEIAEAAREAQTRCWTGSAARDPWTPKCDLYLYPTAKVFSQMTGQPEPSPGFSTMGMNAGRIIARRINLRADHPNLLAAILPHEITHVILADLFPIQQIPRWADEGIAVLSEPTTEQRLRAADLEEPLSSGMLFKVADLMAMDYPDGKYWGLYYAQSVSLTRFLVERGTPAQFIQFVQATQRRSAEAELRRIYQIDGFTDLQKRWLSYARRQATATASARSDETAQR